jgi:DNA-binding beta-propeller fold protein YncE
MTGNFVQAWGGPGEGFEWPETEHGIAIDHNGFVWIGGSSTGGATAPGDDQILKFTKAGKFVMQIGRSNQSKGNTDPANVHGAADVTVYPKTNELFVADGYGNRRVIVYDADTGGFKRMWGAFGNAPTDPQPGEVASAATQIDEGPGPQQFNGVHSARISNDGLVYVSDRGNKRVQVFTTDGKYVKQVFLSRGKIAPSTLPGTAFGKPIKELADGLANGGLTASRTAFSPDPEQRFLYVIDRIRQQIAILDRQTLEILGYFGDGPGSAPGQFYILHDIAVDSRGNAYTAEVNDDGNRRAQKFVLKSLSPAL